MVNISFLFGKKKMYFFFKFCSLFLGWAEIEGTFQFGKSKPKFFLLLEDKICGLKGLQHSIVGCKPVAPKDLVFLFFFLTRNGFLDVGFESCASSHDSCIG